MIEQKSIAITFFAFFTASKQGVLGLSVTVDIFDPTRTKIVTAASATELGDGLYFYTLSGGNTGNSGEHLAVFKTAGAVDQQWIPALWSIGRNWVQDLDAAISSRTTAGQVWDVATSGHQTAGSTGQALSAAGGAGDPLTNAVPGSYASGTAGAALAKIGAGQVVTTSPISSAGNVSVLRGDDYYAVDARAIEWLDAGGTWPDLAAATASLKIDGGPTIALQIITPSGANKKLRLEMSKTATAALTANTLTVYSIQAALSDTHTATIVTGNWETR